MDRDTAISIINEYNSGPWEQYELPQTDEELFVKAEELYQAARNMWEEQGPDLQDKDVRATVQALVWLGDTSDDPHGRDIVPVKAKAIEETYPRRSSGGLSESDEREADAALLAVKEHLPVPPHIEGDPDPMPRDLTTTNDKEVRRLSSEYNAYLTRVTYLLGLASSDLAMAEHLLEAEHARALRDIDKIDPLGDGKKQKLAKILESEILADPEVKRLSDEVTGHQQKVIVLKSLKEIYSGNVDRLSREWTMRQNEWEKSR